MLDWWFWALIPVLIGLVIAFLYVRNKRPSDD